jgi:heme ABC exporter ATP-binding subunit CcmA
MDAAVSTNDAVLVDDAVCDLGGHAALCGARLRVMTGETVLLRGPNGAGKTTMLRLIAGRVAITRGRIQVFGHDLTHHRRAVRGRVGYLSHQTGLYDDMTVQDNLAFRAAAFATAAEPIDGVTELLKLDQRLLTIKAGSLSAGQRKKVALACLALSRCPLWLLDEPHASLDAEASDLCDALLRAAQANGTTIILASHDVERASAIATRTVTIQNGLVVS